jgi:hypothetical protein
MSENTGSDRLKSAADDGAVAEPFDQTNGVVGGLDGDSDETAASDTASGAERVDGDRAGISDTDDVAGQGAMDAGFIVGRQQ